MNYKKAGIIGILCAMGLLAPQKAKGYSYTYVVEEPVTYTTTPVVYESNPIVIQQEPVVYTTYDNTYYDGYYDAMNRRWWYNDGWTYRRPRMCRPYRHYNRHYRMPHQHFNHCRPISRPHFNRCAPVRMHHAPHGGFHHGRGGFHHGHGGRHCR